MSLVLQHPEYAYYRGAVRPYDDAVLHISSEAVVRGLNVFEGLKGYWQPDGSFGIVALRRHYNRLRRSAMLLHIPLDLSFEQFEEAAHSLVAALGDPSRDVWVRATLYVVEGHWGEDTVADMVMTAFHQAKGMRPPVDAGFSSWRRAPDDALPCRIKTSTNYQVARLAKIEGRDRNWPEPFLMNQQGRLAEAVGSCVLVVRDGAVVSPPPWEGCLESITVDLVGDLCRDVGIPFERRPVERSEVLVADELALCSTLNEITPIRRFEGRDMGEAAILTALGRRYLDAATGVAPHPAVDLSLFAPAGRGRCIRTLQAA